MLYRRLIICFVTILVSASALAAAETQQAPIRGDRLSGVVLPVLPRATDIKISALRANAWTVDDTKRLVLEQDVVITIGAYTFESQRAIVWLNRMSTDAGVVSQIAVYLQSFSKTSKRGGLGAAGKDILVVGSTLGSVTMDVALLRPQKPNDKSHLISTANTRLANYIKGLIHSPPPLSVHPKVIEAQQPTDPLDPAYSLIPLEDNDRPWLQPRSGVVSIAADLVELQTSTEENIITVTGNVDLELRTALGTDDMQMSATRGVIFLNPGSVRDIASGKVDTSEIRGVYLEGNVVIFANHGNYLVRAPQIYYDFETGKAIMLESVLRTYVEGRTPLYIRAKELQQVSSDQWIAKGVLASTSSFATPDIAIGSATMTITQKEDGNTYIKSEQNTIRLGGTPIMYWPKYEGVVGDIPLSRVKIGFEKHRGTSVETRWDLFSLLGKPKPQGLSSALLLDGFSKRGVGAGLEFDYHFGNNIGALDLYLMSDRNTQKTDSGRVIPVTHSERGYALWTNETKLTPNWTIQSQLSYISDATFMSVWRESDYTNHQEYETSIYAKYQNGNSAFTSLIKSDLNKFISTSWLLASRQYKVDKAPEFGYYRYADSLLDGLITWSSETRLTRERMVFQRGTPQGLGLRPGAFIFPNGAPLGRAASISSPLIAAGYDEKYRQRITTRHEFSMPLQFSTIKVVPFASIQAQREFGDSAPSTTDWVRTFGLRASTEFNRVYNGVNNDLLDLHRLRHVIEPYLTLWRSDSNVPALGITQFDALLDNVSTGSALWLGVRNRLQTWRGGPGRWYAVDWLTIDAAVLFASTDATQRYDNPQFFDWRPEYSSLEDAAILSGTWQFSDAVSIIGNGTWTLEGGTASTFSRGSIGAELDHGRDVRTYIEYREINNSNDQFLTLGVKYKLSKRYSFNFSPSWNFNIDELQALRFSATRHYPDFDLITQISYNEIRDETQFGFRFNLLKF